jgi:putative PIN family toxin of toxin-antitoxin system
VASRVVLDTNVLYAGLRSRRGASFAILEALWLGKWILVLSNTIVTEYEEILKRESATLNLTHERISRLLDALCAVSERHNLTSLWLPALNDPDDEAVVHLAVEAKADFLLTHNIRHFAPAKSLGVNLVAPRDFLTIIRT